MLSFLLRFGQNPRISSSPPVLLEGLVLAYLLKGQWLNGYWPPTVSDRSIPWKELYPIALSCLIWGQQWRGKKLLFHCDNQSVVDIWAKGSSCDPLFMHLVWSIFFCAAPDQFSVLVSHIRGTDNSIADALSHFQMSRFRYLAPQVDLEPTAVPLSAKTFWQVT